MGGLAEVTVGFSEQFAAGLRVDGMAMFGFGIGEDVSVGVRALAGVLPKVEYKLFSGAVSPMVGLAAGIYTVAVVGAEVSNDNEQVGALAGGGNVFGVAPQVGVDLGGFRIAALSHLIFAEPELEPVFALELSWKTWDLI